MFFNNSIQDKKDTDVNEDVSEKLDTDSSEEKSLPSGSTKKKQKKFVIPINKDDLISCFYHAACLEEEVFLDLIKTRFLLSKEKAKKTLRAYTSKSILKLENKKVFLSNSSTKTYRKKYSLNGTNIVPSIQVEDCFGTGSLFVELMLSIYRCSELRDKVMGYYCNYHLVDNKKSVMFIEEIEETFLGCLGVQSDKSKLFLIYRSKPQEVEFFSSPLVKKHSRSTFSSLKKIASWFTNIPSSTMQKFDQVFCTSFVETHLIVISENRYENKANITFIHSPSSTPLRSIERITEIDFWKNLL